MSPYGVTRLQWVDTDRRLYTLTVSHKHPTSHFKWHFSIGQRIVCFMHVVNCNMHAHNLERGWQNIQYRFIFASIWAAIRQWRPLVQCDIQCARDISRSFSLCNSRKTPNSLSVRARYRMSFVSANMTESIVIHYTLRPRQWNYHFSHGIL